MEALCIAAIVLALFAILFSVTEMRWQRQAQIGFHKSILEIYDVLDAVNVTSTNNYADIHFLRAAVNSFRATHFTTSQTLSALESIADGINSRGSFDLQKDLEHAVAEALDKRMSDLKGTQP